MGMLLRRGLIFLGLMTVLVVAVGLTSAQVAIPDSPAGRTLKAWLTAFNSGDRAQIEAYCKTYDPKQTADMLVGFRNMTGGFELVQILKAEPLHIEYVVKERNSETRAVGTFDVKDGDPALVIEAGLRALPPGADVSELVFKIDAAERTRVIDGAIATESGIRVPRCGEEDGRGGAGAAEEGRVRRDYRRQYLCREADRQFSGDQPRQAFARELRPDENSRSAG
jgi:hypothetical protein